MDVLCIGLLLYDFLWCFQKAAQRGMEPCSSLYFHTEVCELATVAASAL